MSLPYAEIARLYKLLGLEYGADRDAIIRACEYINRAWRVEAISHNPRYKHRVPVVVAQSREAKDRLLSLSRSDIATALEEEMARIAERHAPLRPSASVFLSHNHKDKNFARKLATDLTRWDVRVWIDEAEILVGDSLIAKIREGIDDVDYLAAIISPDAVKSRWVQEELDVAMNQQINGRKVKVLPLLRRKCELPGFLVGKLYLDLSTRRLYTANFPRLLHRLLGRPVDVSSVLRPSLTKLATAGSSPRAVLLVDDNDPSRRYHADLLRAHGFVVIESDDTEQALHACKSRSPALVISNMIRKRGADTTATYDWPEGLRLLYALRREGNMVPFIFLSATYAQGYLDEAKKLMVKAYIGREQTPEAFLAHVERALRDDTTDDTT